MKQKTQKKNIMLIYVKLFARMEFIYMGQKDLLFNRLFYIGFLKENES